MTSLAQASRLTSLRASGSSPVPLSLAAGVAAALVPLVAALGLALVGWFLSDAGAHGQPHDALRVGAVGWLLAHGSGLTFAGVHVTLTPLLLTGLVAWTCWRVGRLLGEAVAAHGPDADRIADGERDWTVPVAVTGLTAGYLLTVVVTATLATSAAVTVSTWHALLGALAVCLVIGAPGVAVGSGRAAVWVAVLPGAVRAAAATGVRVLLWFAAVCGLVLLGALVADLGQAATTVSRLGTDISETLLFLALTTLLVPNAMAFTGSYLLGPGFAVGANTLVAPGAVTLGPLPLLPLLAALPAEGGSSPGWLVTLWVLTPVATAAVAAAVSEHRSPSRRVRDAALRGVVGGAVAGVAVAVVGAMSGGAAGPGRMQQVGVPVLDLLAHGILTLGVGALVGSVCVAWWAGRAARGPGVPAPARAD